MLHTSGVVADANGLILGPYESLCAEIMWFGEAVREAFKVDPDMARFAVPRIPRVGHATRDRILTASLLYGKADASAAGPFGKQLLETVFFANGFHLNMREWEAEFDPFKGVAPFDRFDDTSAVIRGHDLAQMTQDQEAFPRTPRPVVRSVSRTMKRLGITSNGGFDISGVIPTLPTREYVQRVPRDVPWPPDITLATNRAVRLALGCYQSLDKAIRCGYPYLSIDALAPAWTQQTGVEAPYQVVRAILDLPDGPALPRSFVELADLEGDPRLINLREYVEFAVNRILTGDSTALQEVRNEASHVSRRAGRLEGLRRVARTTTFVGLPVGAAEVALGATGPGLVMGSAGFLAEGMGWLLERRQSQHWLTI